MKPLVTPFLNRLRRLARREEGSMSIEAMIIIPVLIWSMLGSWVFFDAFRAQFSNAKASYTLGDIISRESGYITDEYIDSLYTLQRFLAARPEDIRLRVSVIKYDEDDDTHYVVWSENRGGGGTI
ncbi:TadE/TadG family type IV pilus assembly protein, partial [Alexandriicola marinus]|uniref:TadE/TadG family type IV pilus assembly protein n=1 Tax=Alexandriicola marinus TaxID=2081710 RepID=UPI003B848BEA